jgi:hypothetical protein
MWSPGADNFEFWPSNFNLIMVFITRALTPGNAKARVEEQAVSYEAKKDRRRYKEFTFLQHTALQSAVLFFLQLFSSSSEGFQHFGEGRDQVVDVFKAYGNAHKTVGDAHLNVME